jgi:CDP-paratose 2-epimerase
MIMKVLVTGGAGFIGSNLVEHLMKTGHDVRVLDNLSRRGTESNLEYLYSLGESFEFIHGDIRDYHVCERAVSGVDLVFHLAAQVAVTTSVTSPRHDFEVNLLGTFNILEAIRYQQVKPMIVYTSTNKVYGEMKQAAVVELDSRWEYASLPFGNPETTSLDFYSPYGCSKGGADQYVLDYGRIYGFDAVVFRMSCIYGPRQMGCEDQGWVAFFLIQAQMKRGITIFGDGKQVRDVLYVEDLIDALMKAWEHKSRTSGRAYNIGGGPERTLSLLEFITIIQNRLNLPLPHEFSDWRPGDQKVYVSDIRQAARDMEWTPKTSPEEGIGKLVLWIQKNQYLFR